VNVAETLLAAGPGDAVPDMLPSRDEPGRLRGWLDAVIPPLVIFVFLVILWYAFAAYFNYKTLSVESQDINPAKWNHASLVERIRQSLTMSQPELPTPVQAIGDFLDKLRQPPNANGGLWVDLGWTGRVAVLGFLLGALIGVLLAVMFMSSRLLARSLLPYVVASQTIPIVALVPAIVVSIGLGLRSEVLISAYLAFYSITISTYKGLQSVQPLAFELMRSYAATPAQVFFKLRLPAALPYLFTGLKIGVAASLVGAIIAELPSGSPHGIGQSLVLASEYTDNVSLWSTMLAASVLGLVLFGAVVLCERLIIRWRVEPE